MYSVDCTLCKAELSCESQKINIKRKQKCISNGKVGNMCENGHLCWCHVFKCVCVCEYLSPFALQPRDEEKGEEKTVNEENNFVYSCLSIGHTKSRKEKTNKLDIHGMAFWTLQMTCNLINVTSMHAVWTATDTSIKSKILEMQSDKIALRCVCVSAWATVTTVETPASQNTFSQPMNDQVFLRKIMSWL